MDVGIFTASTWENTSPNPTGVRERFASGRPFLVVITLTPSIIVLPACLPACLLACLLCFAGRSVVPKSNGPTDTYIHIHHIAISIQNSTTPRSLFVICFFFFLSSLKGRFYLISYPLAYLGLGLNPISEPRIPPPSSVVSESMLLS